MTAAGHSGKPMLRFALREQGRADHAKYATPTHDMYVMSRFPS